MNIDFKGKEIVKRISENEIEVLKKDGVTKEIVTPSHEWWHVFDVLCGQTDALVNFVNTVSDNSTLSDEELEEICELLTGE